VYGLSESLMWPSGFSSETRKPNGNELERRSFWSEACLVLKESKGWCRTPFSGEAVLLAGPFLIRVGAASYECKE